jgi:hypothetical protein
MDDEAGFFLAAYPEAITSIGERLRAIVRKAVPDSQERIRSGWALIGYDLPIGRRKRYFAFIAPEGRHIHLGFEYGAWMSDPDRVLQGGGPPLRLKKVRFLTFEPEAPLDRVALVELIREGARVASMAAGDRLALALDRGGG